MPPKRFEGKFGIPPSHTTESLLTSALYRLPESMDTERIETLATDIVSKVNESYERDGVDTRLTHNETRILMLKLARYFEKNGESAHLDSASCVDAIHESPRFLRSDKGSIEKLFEMHAMKTLQKIAELRRARAEMSGDVSYNPYENLFETHDGKYYMARLLNMPHLEEESEYMDHCVGTSNAYVNKMKKGDIEIFSFRATGTHTPIATIEYDTHSGMLLQVKGFDDRIPTLSDEDAPDLLEAIGTLTETVNDAGKHREVSNGWVTQSRKLLEIKKRVDAHYELTRDELLFLYEVETPIRGFEDAPDSTADEIRRVRNREEDIRTMCSCAPEHIASEVSNITLDTEMYCNDDGKRIAFVDFRTEKHAHKLPQIIEIAHHLTSEHSPATLDTSFEGGIVSVTVPQKTARALHTWPTARDAYERVDGNSPSYVNDILKDYPYAPLTSPNIDFLVLNHGKTTPQERDTLVSTMAKAGYRPPTLAELMPLGIIRPDLNRRDEILNAYKPHSLGGVLHAPYLDWRDSGRRLGASDASVDWLEFVRFLFVRK